MTCLEFAIRYKIKHKKSKIKIEMFSSLKKINDMGTLIRFLKNIGVVNSLFVLTIPHFYIIDEGFRYETYIGDTNYKLFGLINNPPHISNNNFFDSLEL